MTETDSGWNAKARRLEKYLNHLHTAARRAEVVSHVTEIDQPKWQRAYRTFLFKMYQLGLYLSRDKLDVWHQAERRGRKLLNDSNKRHINLCERHTVLKSRLPCIRLL